MGERSLVGGRAVSVGFPYPGRNNRCTQLLLSSPLPAHRTTKSRCGLELLLLRSAGLDAGAVSGGVLAGWDQSRSRCGGGFGWRVIVASDSVVVVLGEIIQMHHAGRIPAAGGDGRRRAHPLDYPDRFDFPRRLYSVYLPRTCLSQSATVRTNHHVVREFASPKRQQGIDQPEAPAREDNGSNTRMRVICYSCESWMFTAASEGFQSSDNVIFIITNTDLLRDISVAPFLCFYIVIPTQGNSGTDPLLALRAGRAQRCDYEPDGDVSGCVVVAPYRVKRMHEMSPYWT